MLFHCVAKTKIDNVNIYFDFRLGMNAAEMR